MSTPFPGRRRQQREDVLLEAINLTRTGCRGCTGGPSRRHRCAEPRQDSDRSPHRAAAIEVARRSLGRGGRPLRGRGVRRHLRARTEHRRASGRAERRPSRRRPRLPRGDRCRAGAAPCDAYVRPSLQAAVALPLYRSPPDPRPASTPTRTRSASLNCGRPEARRCFRRRSTPPRSASNTPTREARSPRWTPPSSH